MAGISRETQMSIAASSMFPGFRFSPTDVELISYYLKKKINGSEKSVEVIPEVDFCSFEPWDLPAKSIIQSENEWFFFCARGKKYPNGSQSKRATELGYWKATGKERNVKSGSVVVGTKRTLVFHVGRAPKGERTEWIMHEYCMEGKSQDSLVVCRLRKNIDFRPSESSRQASLDQTHLPTTHSSGHALSEGAVDQTFLSEGDRAAEFSLKKCSSSHDSYSIEQIDSESDSEQKPSNGVALAESSTRRKDSDDEDDFYADILKDDIIKLDEPSMSAVPSLLPLVISTPIADVKSKLPVQAVVSPAFSFQGTAHRRIKLKNHVRISTSTDKSENRNNERVSDKVEHPESSKDKLENKNHECVLDKIANLVSSEDKLENRNNECLVDESEHTVDRAAMRRRWVILLVILPLLALFLSVLGGCQPVKRFVYTTLCKDFSL